MNISKFKYLFSPTIVSLIKCNVTPSQYDDSFYRAINELWANHAKNDSVVLSLGHAADNIDTTDLVAVVMALNGDMRHSRYSAMIYWLLKQGDVWAYDFRGVCEQFGTWLVEKQLEPLFTENGQYTTQQTIRELEYLIRVWPELRTLLDKETA